MKEADKKRDAPAPHHPPLLLQIIGVLIALFGYPTFMYWQAKAKAQHAHEICDNDRAEAARGGPPVPSGCNP